MLFHIGALAQRTDRKVCDDVSKQLRAIVRRYGKEDAKLVVKTISGKEQILRSVDRWARETRDLPESDKYLAVLKEQWLQVEGFEQALEDLAVWQKYRNEIIHGLMNKNLDSLHTELSQRCVEGMQLGRYLDRQVRIVKNGNRIRRILKLSTQ